jgi:putative transposase
VNNLIAAFTESSLTKLINRRLLKAIPHYWRMKIAEYQSTLNKYGLKTSKKLRKMHEKWGNFSNVHLWTYP